jgi:hypothetical protein
MSMTRRIGRESGRIQANMELPQNDKEIFRAGASLRIQGSGLDLDVITRELGQNPTYTHKQGEPDARNHIYPHDMQSLGSPLSKGQLLNAHLEWLAEVLLPRKQYIIQLCEHYKVDIYCYKTCYTEQASLVISSKTIRIFTELNLDLQVSLIYLPDEPNSEVGGPD